MIFHIVKEDVWKAALAIGYLEVPSLFTEGFIHASEAHQWAAVRNRYYKNVNGLILLHIDKDLVSVPVKYELAPSVNEMFPHIYGPLNIDAVVKTENL